MKVLIGGEKGGTGKTTLATNLAGTCASAGHKVLLLDTDPQKSASHWCSLRAETSAPQVHCLFASGRIDEYLENLGSTEDYDHIIVDAGGRDSQELRSALLGVDKFYTPVRASQYDLGALDRLNDLIREAKSLRGYLRCNILLNAVATNPKIRDFADAVEFIETYHEFTLSLCWVRDRAAFRRSGETGLSVTEFVGGAQDAKATSEITELYKQVFNVE